MGNRIFRPEELLCMVPQWWIHGIIHLSKLIERTTPRVNPDVNPDVQTLGGNDVRVNPDVQSLGGNDVSV